MILRLPATKTAAKPRFSTRLPAQISGGQLPGVTVEQKSGEIRGVKNAVVVDLPGIYSIRPYSKEEIIARDFIIDTKPDCIINIVDATNIERNLYLTLQLLELGIPTVVALNMMDEERASGGSVNVTRMSALLGVPVAHKRG